MSIRQPVLIYLLIFFGLSLALKAFGVIEFSTLEIFSYALIFYGISLVYSSFGKGKKAALFIGTVLFLLGVVFFLTGSFDFPNPVQIIIPAFMFISGAGFLMLFIDDVYNIILLIISLAFLFIAIFSAAILGTIDLSSYLNVVWIVAKKYWPVVLILLAIIWLLSRDEKG